MRTVKEISDLTGISVRTLHYYDEIGLLKPTEKSEAGYRLYDDTDVFVSLIAQRYGGKDKRNNLAKTQEIEYNKDTVQKTDVPSGLCG